MKTIIFEGVRYTKSIGKDYHYNSVKRKHLHQAVWEHYYGSIPSGYHIHHIDLNKDNNDISNLAMMKEYDHLKLHSSLMTDERKEAMRKNLAQNARPKASEWHGSEEGIKWHKLHYENCKAKLLEKKNYICEECGDSFEAVDNGHNRFCSNKCKSKWRRKSGADNVKKKCSICGEVFSINKYSKTKTCSRSCGSKLAHLNREAE